MGRTLLVIVVIIAGFLWLAGHNVDQRVNVVKPTPVAYATTPAGNPGSGGGTVAQATPAAANSPQNSTTLNSVSDLLKQQSQGTGFSPTAVVTAKDSGKDVGLVMTIKPGTTIPEGACIDYDGRSDSVSGATWSIHNGDFSKTRAYVAPGNKNAKWNGNYNTTVYYTPCSQSVSDL